MARREGSYATRSARARRVGDVDVDGGARRNKSRKTRDAQPALDVDQSQHDDQSMNDDPWEVACEETRALHNRLWIEEHQDQQEVSWGGSRREGRWTTTTSHEILADEDSSNRTYQPCLVQGVPGGPTNPEVLKSFKAHIAYAIWTDHDFENREPMTVHGRQLRLGSWRVPDRDNMIGLQEWATLVIQSGLTHLQELMYAHVDMALLTAFVERWQPETNTFHMPWGEMTVTLHDVAFILSLPIDGKAVYLEEGWDNDKDYTEAAKTFNMERDAIKKEFKRGGLSYTSISEMQSDKVWIQQCPKQASTLFLLYLIGSTLFPDKSHDRVPYRYLRVLYDVEEVGDYAWGTAALAYLYRELGKGSRKETTQLSGCATLLQAWIYLYFPNFRGKVSGLWDRNVWAAAFDCRTPPSKKVWALKDYRRMIDEMCAEQVLWQPFGEGLDFVEKYRTSLYHGTIACMSAVEPYMPDRVARQFGRIQGVPLPPIVPLKAFRKCEIRRYVVNYHFDEALWHGRSQHCFRLEQLGPPARYAWDVASDYMDWFIPRTHPRVTPPHAQRQPSNHLSVPRDAEWRIQQVAGLLRPYAIPPFPDPLPQWQNVMITAFSRLNEDEEFSN